MKLWPYNQNYELPNDKVMKLHRKIKKQKLLNDEIFKFLSVVKKIIRISSYPRYMFCIDVDAWCVPH